MPHITASYADGPKDQEDEAIPMCTLRNFPSLIEHCIEWARSGQVFLGLGGSGRCISENSPHSGRNMVNSCHGQKTYYVNDAPIADVVGRQESQ